MKPDLETIKEWIAQCENKPLMGGDVRYVPLELGKFHVLDSISKTIMFSQRPTCQVICGQSGLGVSTFLYNSIAKAVRCFAVGLGEVTSYEDFHLQLKNRLSINNPDTGILFQGLKAAFSYFRENDIALLVDFHQPLEGIVDLFRDYVNKLRLSCHVVYCLPFTMPLVYPEIATNYDRWAMFYPPDVQQNAKKQILLRELVEKRVPVETVFGKPQLLDRMIYFSGGLPGTLLRMVRELLIHHADQTFPVDQASVDHVIDVFKRRAGVGLRIDDAKLLARVHEMGNLDAIGRSETKLLAENSAHFIVYHGNPDRYVLHPLSKDRILELARESEPRSQINGLVSHEPDHNLKNLKVASVHLQNIRCFKDIRIDLSSNKQAAAWTTILGNNAVGKTSLLRAVVLGLCEESTATALIKKIPGSFIRRGETEAKIVVELENGSKNFSITTTIQKAPDGENEIVRKVTEPNPFPWQDIFVCAYGVERTKQADQGFERYRMDQAVMTLFNYNGSLQNPELILLRQGEDTRKQIEEKLLQILMLDSGDNGIAQTGSGLEVTGPWGSMPFDALSDGYRGTMQWLVDFIAWAIYARRMGPEGPTGGVVFIDELEQHLHPRWQRQIIARLKQHFPHVQFMITTHSPLIAGSVGSFTPQEGEGDKILHLTMNEEGHIELDELDSVRGLALDQVLASPAFDYLVQADPQVERVLAEASRLAGRGEARTEAEEARYTAIKKAIGDMMQRKGNTLIEQEIHKELYSAMMDEIEDLEAAVFGKGS